MYGYNKDRRSNARGQIPTPYFKYKKKLMKKPIGDYEYFDDVSVYVAHYNDTNVVAMMKNVDQKHVPVKHVQRHVRGQLGRRQGYQPLMVVNYIAGMGAIDLIDCLLGAFCPQIVGGNGGGLYL